ncbi:hypothetical protein A4R44_04948 [Amycolatopsis sp. M39]|nr:hypothetical protein A4R44_04948 [Amycolatopsis sp. M39]
MKLTCRVDDEHRLVLSESHRKMLCLEIVAATLVWVWLKVLNLDRMKYETLRPLLLAKEPVAWLKRERACFGLAACRVAWIHILEHSDDVDEAE